METRRGLVVAVMTAFIGMQSCMAAETVKVSAKCYSFTPSEITLKKGVPVTFELTTEDRMHGFAVPAWKVSVKIPRDKTTELKVTPDKTGEFPFFCDVFCGSGHDNMTGTIKVVE